VGMCEFNKVSLTSAKLKKKIKENLSLEKKGVNENGAGPPGGWVVTKRVKSKFARKQAHRGRAAGPDLAIEGSRGG